MLPLTRSRRELGRATYASLVDYHIHTPLCGHARGDPELYVREAIRKGLGEIGFSDHMPMLTMHNDHLTMRPEELPLYVETVRDLQESVDDLTIRLGIEMDYFPGQMDEVWEAAKPYAFDYVYGSVHYLDGWDFGDSRNLSNYRDVDHDSMYRQYFRLFCEAVEHGGFDVMAHPDLVKKHGATTSLPLKPMYEAAAEALARADVAIEVNSSGLRQHVVELYPTLEFLSMCASRGVAVTLGSDAHSPGQVGMDFDLSLAHLRRAGITEIATFAGRKRTMRPVPG